MSSPGVHKTGSVGLYSVICFQYIVTRLGRWIDFKNDYKTMYPWFMETIWWVFKELYNKGLVYRGFKVSHMVLYTKVVHVIGLKWSHPLKVFKE